MASRLGDIDSRIQALEAQLADDPASPAFFPLAGLNWEKGDADKAIDLLTSGLQHHAAYTAPRVLLGEIYLAKDQIGDAASELEKAIARSPWNLAAQRFLMDCHKKSGDEGGVRRALVAIGMFDPGDAAAAALKEGGAAPAYVPSAPARGEVSVGEALIEEAGDAVPTESLAELYVSQGHLEKALDVYRTLAEEDPENTDYLEKISDLQDQLGAGGGAAPEVGAEAASEPEDFDAILAEAAGGDDGAAESPELEDFDSILDEAAGGEVDDLDALFADEPEEAAAPAPAAADAGGEVDDLDALFADESEEPSAPAPVADADAVDESDDLAALGEPPDEPGEEEAAAEADDLAALGEPPDEPGGEEAAAEAGAELEAGAEEAGADEGFGDLDALFEEELGESVSAEVPEGAPEEALLPEDAEISTGDAEAIIAEEPIAAEVSEVSDEADPVAEAALEEVPEGEEGPAVEEPALEGPALGEDAAGEGDDLDALFAEEMAEIENDAAAEEAPSTDEPSASDEPGEAGAELEAESGEDVYLESVVFEEEEESQVLTPESSTPEVSNLEAEPPESPPQEGLPQESISLTEEPAPEAAPETEPADLSEAAEAAPGEADITGDMAAMEEPAPESAPSPALSKAEEMMSGIIDMYINEGNAPLALDLCRKALTAERDSAWLEAKIQELEARLAESGEGDLPRPAEEVIEDAEPSYSGPHSDVVKSLEGWLRTIQRRKARM
jgi:tetratricopeptide (TPR) repeat protein